MKIVSFFSLSRLTATSLFLFLLVFSLPFPFVLSAYSEPETPVLAQPKPTLDSEFETKTNLKAPAKATETQVTNQSEKTEKDPFVAKLESIVWEPVPEDTMRMTYKEALSRAADKNLDVRISLAKVTETQAKQASIENKRLLFFFKYFNSEYFEGSAESDVNAAKQHQVVVSNKALLESSTYYFDLMRSVMNTYISHQVIRQGLKQLQFNQSQFDTGETTSFELMQTKTELIQRYQNFLKASLIYEDASLRLSQYLNLDSHTLLYPEALSYHDAQFKIERLNLFPDQITEKQVVYLALMNRADLKEAEYRKRSIANILKAHAKQFDKNSIQIVEATLKQMELKYEKAKRGIRTTSINAYNHYQFSQRKITLAEQQLKLASTALRQVQISYKAGFSSNKDVLDAQVAYSQAQVNQANSLIEHNLSQIKLLYETGLITLDTLLQAKPTTEEAKISHYGQAQSLIHTMPRQ